jgi:periplasmic mercuric ion binding protein
MKKVMLSIAVLAVIGMTSCKNQTEEKQETTEEVNEIAMVETTFGVRGNCGMCKKNIETAANSVDGVVMANWDIDLKKIDVKFDDSKTNEKAIHNAIAASGYDTDKVAGNKEAYNELPQCCQYDHTMEMSLTEPADGEGGNHHHME